MPIKFPRVASHFLPQLKKGGALCLMPVPRLELGLEPIDISDLFRIYPRGEVNIAELNVVSYPRKEFDTRQSPIKNEDKAPGVGIKRNDLSWYQSAATRIDVVDFDRHALIGFIIDVSEESLLEASHSDHKALIRLASEHAEQALDLIRFEECRLDLPDSLPGRVGTFDLATPYSAAAFYFLPDNQSYIIAGQCVTHLIAAGIGLQIEVAPAIAEIGDGEVGHIARRALGMFTEALESNSETDKFVRAISTLEFLAGGGDFLNMKKAKSEIATHLASSRQEYHEICARFRALTAYKNPITNFEEGLRTRIVHMGDRLETMLPNVGERRRLFTELHRYLAKPIQDLIEMSALDWPDVLEFRNRRKHQLGVSGDVS